MRAACVLFWSAAAAAACDTCPSTPGSICCDPTQSPPQVCYFPGGGSGPCCDCGGAACLCVDPAPQPPSPPAPAPTPAPAPAPTPAPAPAPTPAPAPAPTPAPATPNTPAPAPDMCKPQTGLDCYEDNLPDGRDDPGMRTRVTSAADCCALCQNATGTHGEKCAAWTWYEHSTRDHDGQVCWLKTGCSRPVANDGVSGGATHQPRTPTPAGPPMPTVRIAFIGNSFIFCDGTDGNEGYYNHLPKTMQSLARSGGLNIEFDHVTPGRTSIWDKANMSYHCDCLHWSGHGRDAHCTEWLSCGEKTQRMLEDPKGWDFVVLQDHSQVPGESAGNDNGVKRTTRVLREWYAPLIDAAGAQAVLFNTWGYQKGDVGWDPSYTDFLSMNRQMVSGYQRYAKALTSALNGTKEAQIAPCARAWELAYNLTGRDISEHSRFSCMYSCNAPNGQRWTPPCWPDWWGRGAHPGPFGTYVNACVFYMKLFGKSPVGLEYAPDGVSDEMRDWAQQLAVWAVSGTKPAPLPPPAPPATPEPACLCGDDYPHCSDDDHYCYRQEDRDHWKKSSSECPGHCTPRYTPAPGAPVVPKKPCTCGSDFPHCNDDTRDYSHVDYFCYTSEGGRGYKSDTECPGKCTKSYRD